MTSELRPGQLLPGQRGSLLSVEWTVPDAARGSATPIGSPEPPQPVDVLAERHLMRYGCHPIGCLMAGVVLGYLLFCLLW